jgi:hypothetical protein
MNEYRIIHPSLKEDVVVKADFVRVNNDNYYEFYIKGDCENPSELVCCIPLDCSFYKISDGFVIVTDNCKKEETEINRLFKPVNYKDLMYKYMEQVYKNTGFITECLSYISEKEKKVLQENISLIFEKQ